MSLVSTLAKVAIGVALAKGASQLTQSGQGRNASAGSSTDGLGGLLEQLAGQNTAKRPTSSGIEDLLGSLTGGGAGGLGGLLGGLTGASRSAAGAGNAGGLGDMLGGLLGGAAASGAATGGIGGLGGMLGEMRAGKQPSQTPNAQQEVAAALMLKAMVQAAKSDGKLDQSEKQKLMENLGEADRQEIALVNDLLAQPVDIDALVNATPRGLEEQVYLMSLMAIDLDSQPEAQYLDHLAKALGLDHASANQIHDQADAQRLYS